MARAHPLNVLATLDRARTQRYHFAAAAIAGTGFLAGAYNLFSIIFVARLIGRVYYADETATPGEPGGQLPPDAAAALNGVAFSGTFVGQLAFGWLGDRIGRRRAYGWTLALMAVSSAASGLSFGREAKAVLATLCFFRFWLGVGVGGSYPLSAVIIAEYANKRTRGAFVAAVHAMQGVGILLGGTVALGVCSVVPKADHVWRVILVAGAVPAALSFYLRTKLPETARYTALVAREPKRAAADMSQVLRTRIQEQDLDVSVGRVDDEWGLFSVQFLKSHGLHLLATSSACFLLSVTYYSQNILQKDLLGKLGWVSLPFPGSEHGRRPRSRAPRPRAGAHRALRRHPGVHPVGRPRAAPPPARRLRGDDALNARPRHLIRPLDVARCRLLRALQRDLLLRQRRAQHHHVCRARGALPGAAPVHVPRRRHGRGAGRRGSRGVRVSIQGRRLRVGHWYPERAVRAGRHQFPGHADVSVRPGDEGRVTGGTVQGGHLRIKRHVHG